MKVEYGIKNVYIAIRRKSTDGNITYDTPFEVPYARSTDLAPQGETTEIYADNMKILMLVSNQGYSGNIAFTIIPDDVLEKILDNLKDDKGILIEDAERQPVEFALMFQFENDEKARRHIFYNCVATRPNVASKTKEKSITVDDKSITVEARPDTEIMPGFSIVKGQSTATTNADTYNNWFSHVQIPTIETA